MRLDWDMLPGLRVTVMGLGLHGGGVAAAAFLAEHGSEVTVTDLRGEAELAESVAKLAPHRIRFVLGRHDTRDFESADIVVKNPAVGADSPYLQHARRLETDISIFLSLVDIPLIAVTGTKGKSTTASAIHHALKALHPEAKLGGNITVSPLTFADELARSRSKTPVVLELSSWQLADLRGRGLLTPRAAVVTNVLPDHLNRYASMEEYVADKAIIYSEQTQDDFTICNFDNPYTRAFAEQTAARPRVFSSRPLGDSLEGAWLDGPQERGIVRSEEADGEVVPVDVALPGRHNRMNLLAAGLSLVSLGIRPGTIAPLLAEFPGIRHRLELVADIDDRRYYNDSAATIPEAAAAAVESFRDPLVLIAGGTDKELDFAPFRALSAAPKCVVLLSGSATGKLTAALRSAGIRHVGPYDSMDAAVAAAASEAEKGDVVVLSPGCASFEMFKNEFDRGDRFVCAVKGLLRGARQ